MAANARHFRRRRRRNRIGGRLARPAPVPLHWPPLVADWQLCKLVGERASERDDTTSRPTLQAPKSGLAAGERAAYIRAPQLPGPKQARGKEKARSSQK